MKLLLLFLSFLHVVFNCSSQKIEATVIQLAEDFNSAQKEVLPFSAIQIIDARFDKSSVGCAIKNLSFNGATRDKKVVVFPDSVEAYLPRIVSRLYSLSSANQDTLVMLLKHFRFADHVFQTLATQYKGESVLMIAVSFYKKTNSRLYKIGSIENRWSKEWHDQDHDSGPTFSAARNKASTELFMKIFQNRQWAAGEISFSWAEMADGLRRRYQLPILTDTVLKAGAYRSYDEFKNNIPSVTHLTFHLGKDILKDVKDKNGKLIEGPIWGACDGKDVYILDGKFRKLFRSHNGFRYVSDQYQDKHWPSSIFPPNPGIETSAGTIFLPSPFPNYRHNTEFFDLNMDTGAQYQEEKIGAGELKIK